MNGDEEEYGDDFEDEVEDVVVVLVEGVVKKKKKRKFKKKKKNLIFQFDLLCVFVKQFFVNKFFLVGQEVEYFNDNVY